MTVALLVMTDGRHCIAQTLAAIDKLDGPIVRKVIHDDSADPDHRTWLRATFPDFEVVGQPERQGFGGAIRNAWAHLLKGTKTEHVFHLEDDFVLERPVDLQAMADLLAARPQLAQVALRRQPVCTPEREAGGVVEMWPDAYTDCDGWLEHELFFTTNPSLYRRSLLRIGWPQGDLSEQEMTRRLLGLEYRFAFWGERSDGPWVTHIGDERHAEGTGY